MLGLNICVAQYIILFKLFAKISYISPKQLVFLNIHINRLMVLVCDKNVKTPHSYTYYIDEVIIPLQPKTSSTQN